MNNVYAHFLVAQFFQRLAHCLHAALHVRLDNQIELFNIPFFDLIEQIVQRSLCAGLKLIRLNFIPALLHNLSAQLVVVRAVENISGVGHVVKAQHLHGHRRPRFFHALSLSVHHGADAAARCAGHYGIAHPQRTVLHQNGGHRPSALIQPGLHNRASGLFVRISLILIDVGHQQYHL